MGSKDKKIFDTVSEKLNGMYEKAYQLILNINKICNGVDKYPMLINSENVDPLFYNIRLKGFELNKLLETIEREYDVYSGMILWVNKIKPLCEGGYNLSDYKLYARANISEFDFY